MSIKFTYEILSVSEESRCMDVKFMADGMPTMIIGARLPFEGETLEQVLLAFAPIPYWEDCAKAVVAPQVGASGEINPVQEAAPVVDPTTAFVDQTTV